MKQLLVLCGLIAFLVWSCNQANAGADCTRGVLIDTAGGKWLTGAPVKEPLVKYRILAFGYSADLEKELNNVSLEIAQLDFWYIADVTYQNSAGTFSAMVTIKKIHD